MREAVFCTSEVSEGSPRVLPPPRAWAKGPCLLSHPHTNYKQYFSLWPHKVPKKNQQNWRHLKLLSDTKMQWWNCFLLHRKQNMIEFMLNLLRGKRKTRLSHFLNVQSWLSWTKNEIRWHQTHTGAFPQCWNQHCYPITILIFQNIQSLCLIWS